MTRAVLTPNRVQAIFKDCLLKKEESTDNRIVAEGFLRTVTLHGERIESHRQEIHDMLAELPDTFKQGSGNGWSFLEAQNDRYGHQWTGLNTSVEQLVQLGIAIGEVEYLTHSDLWKTLPGGMPYFVVQQ